MMGDLSQSDLRYRINNDKARKSQVVIAWSSVNNDFEPSVKLTYRSSDGMGSTGRISGREMTINRGRLERYK